MISFFVLWPSYFSMHIPKAALHGFATCLPSNNNQVPPVCLFFVLNMPSSFAALNLMALGLCNALKVHSWPGKKRKKKVFKGAFLSTFLCPQISFYFGWNLLEDSYTWCRFCVFLISMRLFGHWRKGRVWTLAGSNRLWNHKGNLQVGKAIPY